MNKIRLRFLWRTSFFWLLPLSGCTPMPFVYVFLRNTSAGPVVVWLKGPGKMVQGVFRSSVLLRKGQYHNTLLYAPALVRPTRKNADRMHDSLAVAGTGPTLKFTVPKHSTVWLGVFTRWGQNAFPPELRLQRADSVVSVLNEAALAKAAHGNFLGERRLWLDI
ncbi:hypothetical protein [Hymenobacter ruricola]|uniref:Uncharacterized protein n=1 Tax=Hymenobacter ruricola TaxID=2791023 RepID=A0ABS0I8F6_9BACT|nr:hypothetical protein [Hymenobacter ruricola]MBF9223189.1 hypothetical protein [Hymenobacter ruricola]